MFYSLDKAIKEALRYKKRAKRLRKRIVLLKQQITELETKPKEK